MRIRRTLPLAAAALGALGALALGPVQPASAADQTEPSCAGMQDGDYANPNDGRSYYSCDAGTYLHRMPCTEGTDGQLLYYVDESGPAPRAAGPRSSRCDRMERAGGDHTPTLTTMQAKATVMHPRVVQGLGAKVLRPGGVPLFGAKVEFIAVDGTHLCTAYANREGTAFCDSDPVTVNDETLRLGYTAEFAGSGDGVWNPVSAPGSITVL